MEMNEMGMDTLAYKTIRFDSKEGFVCENSFDDLNREEFKYPNSELYNIAEKFYTVSKGDIDFRNYIMYEKPYDFDIETPKYLTVSEEFYESLKDFDFEAVEKILLEALDYYEQYELDFKPDMYRHETDRQIVEYLLELAKQRYYIFWSN